MDTRPLFDRLGGSPGIGAIVEDIVALHTENPTIRARFPPYLEEPDRLAVLKRHTC
jgi:hemoglobin